MGAVQGQNHDMEVSLSVCVQNGGRVLVSFPSLETGKDDSCRPSLAIPNHSVTTQNHILKKMTINLSEHFWKEKRDDWRPFPTHSHLCQMPQKLTTHFLF